MWIRALGLVALLAPGVAAQPLTLSPRADANAGLPLSVRVFDVTRDGTSLRASLIRADLAATDWALEAVLSDEGGETVRSFAEDDGVLAAINGGYFGGGQSFSLVLNDGVVLSPQIAALTRSGVTFYPTRGAFGLSRQRQPDVAWVYDVDGETYAYPAPSPNRPGAPAPRPTATAPEGGAPWAVETAIGGGPVLVQDRRPALTWTEEVFFGGSGVDTTDARARTAVGYTADHLLLVVVSERNGLTLPALAALLADLGAIEAVNLDGGGSSAMSAGGLSLVTSSRPVLSALRIRTPGGDGPAETTFDTGDAGYRETGDWFESANAPFFGGTRSRLNETGTGDDRAVFRLDGIAAGRYRLEAWWTPAPNRATNAPFTVHAGGTSQTVRVDQSAPGTAGVWNPIGEFDLAPGDSVVVTDAATGTAIPAYVCVDGLRLVPSGATASDPAPAPLALRVWPNPSAGSLTVALGEGAAFAHVEIVDALGRMVRQQHVRGAREVRIEALAAGAYLVRVRSEGQVRTARATVVR